MTVGNINPWVGTSIWNRWLAHMAELKCLVCKRRRGVERELYGGYRSRSRPDFISVPCCRFSILSRESGTRYIRVSTVSCFQHVSGHGSHADVCDWFGTSSDLATGSSKPRRSSVTYVSSGHNEVFENVASRAIRSSTLRVTYSSNASVPSNSMMSTEARLCWISSPAGSIVRLPCTLCSNVPR